MRGILPTALLVIAGCASAGPPPEAPAAAAAEEVPSPPRREDLPGRPSEVRRSFESTFPRSIVIDASVTRFDPATGEPVQVKLRGGKPVAWARTEIGPDPGSFDPAVVTAAVVSVDLQRTFRDGPWEACVRCSVTGLPADATTLGLDSAASEVVWGDGSRGAVRALRAQGPKGDSWSFDAVTTVPPDDSRIRSMAIALDLHRKPPCLRWEARIGVDESAVFEFEGSVSKWTLSSDLHVTEFSVARHRSPDLPPLEWSPASVRLAGLADAEGRPLRKSSASGAGSISILEWILDYGTDPVPPVIVTVEAPLASPPTRLVLRLEDLRPRR